MIAGHGRLLAAGQLGSTEVPTLCLDHLTPAQARAFVIADNRLAETTTWDDRLLAEQLEGFSLLGLDFSIEVIGFEMTEIDLRIEALEKPPSRKDDAADQMPELDGDPPLSKIGDLWGSLYRSQYELVFVLERGRAEPRDKLQRRRVRRNRSDVWHYPEAKSVLRRGEEGNSRVLPGTAKPVAMVLDSFLGSGTTLIAAERTSRRCYRLELDPTHVDAISRRWGALTGGSARHAASGRSFDDLAREVEAANAA